MGRTKKKKAAEEELEEIEEVYDDESVDQECAIGNGNGRNDSPRTKRAQRRQKNNGSGEIIRAGDETSEDLLQQMVTHQANTVVALQELSQTMTNLMLQKQDSEASDATAFNVDRATVRLDGLEVYAVVSALTLATAIACFDAYGSDFATTIFEVSHITRDNLVPLVMNTIFLIVSGVGIIAGLHATLVFSLMTMYGRTAVGVSHDAAFVEFFVQTGRVRYRGFLTFRLSLYCFLVQVIFTLTSKCSPILRPLIIFINLASMYQVYVDTQSVIDKAGEILFGNKSGGNSNTESNAGDESDNGDNDGYDENDNALRRTLSRGKVTNANDVNVESDDSIISAVRRSVSAMVGGTVASGVTTRAASTSQEGTAQQKGKGKTPARSKSGVEVYDVIPNEARPARRGRRKKNT